MTGLEVPLLLQEIGWICRHIEDLYPWFLRLDLPTKVTTAHLGQDHIR